MIKQKKHIAIGKHTLLAKATAKLLLFLLKTMLSARKCNEKIAIPYLWGGSCRGSLIFNRLTFGE